MHVDQLVFSQADAAKLHQKYKTHRAYQQPIDHEIERIAGLIAKGKMVIRGAGSVTLAGLNAEHLPKLAIARADAAFCLLRNTWHGGAQMLSGLEWANGNTARDRLFNFPQNTFPTIQQGGNWRAVMPHIPPDIRPKRGIENYHVIWEAVWKPEPPIDPILCRRVGKSDFFLVLAQWDLTEVERFVMASRIGRQ